MTRERTHIRLEAAIRISLAMLVTLMALTMTKATAQGNRTQDTVPVLLYEAPQNFIRIGAGAPDDYSSTQFNGSIQVYPFEPFQGNIAEIFQRTLLRDRIDARYREENVAMAPQFGQGEIPGAQAVFHANFVENIVGIPRPHLRIAIVAGGYAAIVDAHAINTSLMPQLGPQVNALAHTLLVDTASGPPRLIEGPGPSGRVIAGLYRGTKPKFMTGLTFQASYFVSAPHFYLFSETGRVYRCYDQIRAPGGDIRRFDFDLAQRSDPSNSGRYTIRDDKLYIKIGNAPVIVTAVPKGDMVTVESVAYARQ